jgi:hypothetical protein
MNFAKDMAKRAMDKGKEMAMAEAQKAKEAALSHAQERFAAIQVPKTGGSASILKSIESKVSKIVKETRKRLGRIDAKNPSRRRGTRKGGVALTPAPVTDGAAK